MNKTDLYDTLDIISGFSAPNFEARAAQLARSTDPAVLKMLGAGDMDAARDLIKHRLEREHPQAVIAAIAHLNALAETERAQEIYEYLRQRHLRDVQTGYDRSTAQNALEVLRSAGVQVSASLLQEVK